MRSIQYFDKFGNTTDNMFSKLSFLAAFIFIFSMAMSQETSTDYSEFESHVFQDDGYSLPYRLLTPDTIVKERRYPLVIFFHGSGERGTDNTQHLKHIAPLFLDTENRRNYPSYILVPQCPEEESWTYPDWYTEPKNPMKTVIKIIEEYMTDPNIDTTRIYITGLSIGGYATWYLLTRFPRRFAAAIPICGGGDWARASSFASVPIWAFHGRKDDTVPVDQTRNMISALKDAGGNPKYTEYKKVKHNSWDYAYREEGLLEWMFGQKRPKY